MKPRRRKIEFALIFLVCWFALLVFLVDGVVGFRTIVDIVGSHALTETILILLVLVPAGLVYLFTKE